MTAWWGWVARRRSTFGEALIHTALYAIIVIAALAGPAGLAYALFRL